MLFYYSPEMLPTQVFYYNCNKITATSGNKDMTVGDRSPEEVRRHITDYLFNILDMDKNGTVDLQELEDYVSTYGLVANLNVASEAR